MKLKNILALGTAVGLAALATGCKSDNKRLEGCRESITPDMISVCKEHVPMYSGNAQVDIGSYRYVQLVKFRDESAFLTLSTDANETVITAETIFGDNVLGYSRDGSYSFRVEDNPYSVSVMGLKENEWKYVCSQIDCKGLLEKQEKLAQGQ